jgi:hypothetical protein
VKGRENPYGRAEFRGKAVALDVSHHLVSSLNAIEAGSAFHDLKNGSGGLFSASPGVDEALPYSFVTSMAYARDRGACL